jgi:hypothetical protein
VHIDEAAIFRMSAFPVEFLLLRMEVIGKQLSVEELSQNPYQPRCLTIAMMLKTMINGVCRYARLGYPVDVSNGDGDGKPYHTVFVRR